MPTLSGPWPPVPPVSTEVLTVKDSNPIVLSPVVVDIGPGWPVTIYTSVDSTNFSSVDVAPKPRTQKARSVLWLWLARATPYLLQSLGLQPLHATVATTEQQLRQQLVDLLGPRFARPCPLTPQHGFVDSRVVTTVEEAVELFRQARHVDPHAELILMPYVKAQFSAVWTPTSLNIGAGNDGATSGRSYNYPQVQGTWVEDLRWWAGFTALVDTDRGEAPYLEAVYGRIQIGKGEVVEPKGGIYGDGYIVQIRSGPPVPELLTDCYVPHPVTVKEVVEAKGTLVDWAAAVRQFKEGTVAWGPGLGFGSHWAVHCIENQVPFSRALRKPAIGEKLTAEKLTPHDPLAALQGIFAGERPIQDTVDVQRRVAHLVWATHQAPALRGLHSYHLGLAAANL